MRKAVVTALAAVVLLVAFAAPAFALRDPFDPAITSDSQTSTTDTTDTTTDAGEPAVTNENPFSDNVPETGADTSSWLVLSYMLVVLGGAAIVLGRTLSPTPSARRQDFRS